MSERVLFTCPRSSESGPLPHPHGDMDYFQEDDRTCTYCGSLDPDVFMARLEQGTISLGATDKNYKVYVHNEGGDPILQRYRTDVKPFKGWDSPEHDWHVHESTGKFYFQHLSIEQRKQFVKMYNEQRLRMHGGFNFYVAPFFMRFA